jgi:hypothetical protein
MTTAGTLHPPQRLVAVESAELELTLLFVGDSTNGGRWNEFTLLDDQPTHRRSLRMRIMAMPLRISIDGTQGELV